MFQTVGEFKKYLETLDDNMPIVTTSANFELYGSKIAGCEPHIEKLNKTTKMFMDSFDYTEYTKEVYERTPDNNGIECLCI